jgi:hypothetical protein
MRRKQGDTKTNKYKEEWKKERDTVTKLTRAGQE